MNDEERKADRKMRNFLTAFIISVIAVPILIYAVFRTMEFYYYKTVTPAKYFEYHINGQGTVTIDRYIGKWTKVNIPETINGLDVTEIAHGCFSLIGISDNSFLDYLEITDIHLPDTVKRIGDMAFCNLCGLKRINMPESLEYTGCMILTDTSVSELVFPEGITVIGYNDSENNDLPRYPREAFWGMKKLKKVVFPQSLERIENTAFMYCPELKEVTLPEGLEYLGFGAFQFSGLEKINIPSTLKEINGCAFRNTPFEQSLLDNSNGDFITLNETMLYRYIGKDSVPVIPDGITYICGNAFCETNIKNAVLPAGLTQIGDSAFRGCISLERIVIPENVTYIGDYAFQGCTVLKDVIIYGEPYIGKNVFDGCDSLAVIPQSIG